MPYDIKEVFYTLQGEGMNTGRPAVFVRFSGCNLWNGREFDRLAAICKFCDTDFVGGSKYHDSHAVVKEVESVWPCYPLMHKPRPLVVLTGGEPSLQVDQSLISALRSRGFEISIETNGTKQIPPGIQHVTVSPKAGSKLIVTSGDELKLVFPQVGAEPKQFEQMNFKRFYLQPLDGPDREFHQRSAAKYCLENPVWSLSLQTHKILGLR